MDLAWPGSDLGRAGRKTVKKFCMVFRADQKVSKIDENYEIFSGIQRDWYVERLAYIYKTRSVLK